MCVYVSVSAPLQITLGVLFIIVQVSWLFGYFRKFDYFILPQECSHILQGNVTDPKTLKSYPTQWQGPRGAMK